MSPDYSADIALCVDRNGYFATVAETQPVSIGMRIPPSAGSLAERSYASRSKPPDFLIADSLRDARRLGQLRSSLPFGVLQSMGLQQGSAWTDFRPRQRAGGGLRIGRDKNKDIDGWSSFRHLAGRLRTPHPAYQRGRRCKCAADQREAVRGSP